tara:strand:+ start:71 stop:391 length:321 start_codon:yes stop_codon:yes gene_type:complete
MVRKVHLPSDATSAAVRPARRLRACEHGLDLRDAPVHLHARRLAVSGVARGRGDLARRRLVEDVRVDALAQGKQRCVLRAPLAALLLLEQLLDLVSGTLVGESVSQ